VDITMSTVVRCITLLCNKTEKTLIVGTDVPVNSTVRYIHKACDGGYIASYDSDGECLHEYKCDAGATMSAAEVGGGFAVTSKCSTIHVGSTLIVHCDRNTTVGSIINDCDDLYKLVDTLATTDLVDEDVQQVINLYFEFKKSSYGDGPVDAETLNGKTESELNVATAENAETLNGKTESELNVATAENAENAEKLEGNTVNNIMLKIYPVGSVYVTSTNESPASYLGGTWSLVGKEFSAKHGTSSTDGVLFSMNTTNTTAYTCYYLRHGQTIRIRIGIKNAVALSDTSLDMGSLNFNALGISGLGFTQQCCSSCDGGNVVVLNQIAYDTGAIQVLDIIGADTVAAGNTFFVDVILQPRMDTMLNSACDKFYWKRTA